MTTTTHDQISREDLEHQKLQRWIQQLALDIVAVKGSVRCRMAPDGRTQHVMIHEDPETGMTICVTTKASPYLQIEIPDNNGGREVVFEVICTGSGTEADFDITVFVKGPWVNRLNFYTK